MLCRKEARLNTMDEGSLKLTVFFDDPFWVGVFERIENGMLSACKITFGAEPKDNEIFDFINGNHTALQFSPAITAAARACADNPKRRQRSAKRLLQGSGIGTKSQQALAARREEMKTERKKLGREQREAQKQRRFELKQQQRKQRHKGH